MWLNKNIHTQKLQFLRNVWIGWGISATVQHSWSVDSDTNSIVYHSSGVNLLMCLFKFSLEKILLLIPIFIFYSQFSF